MSTPRDIFLGALERRPAPRPATGSATSVVTVDLMEEVGVFFPEAHLGAEPMAALAEAGHTVLGFDNVMPLFGVWHESAAMGGDVEWGERDRLPDCRRPLYALGDAIRIPPDLLSRPGCQVPLDAIALLRRRLGDEVAVVGKVFGPWTLGYPLFTVQEFLIATKLDPDAVHRAMDTLMRVTVEFGRAQIDAGADCILLADHATSDLCSPKAYRDFLLPMHRRLADLIKAPVILHICGNTCDRIGMISQTHLSCFHWDTKTGTAQKARQLAGDRLSLMGGISNFKLLRSSPEEIRTDAAEAAKESRGANSRHPEND